MKVGDQVWYVPSDSRHRNPNGSLATITKIGRKYFYVNNGDYHDMKCIAWNYNGYAIGKVEEYPYGTIYATEQDYLDFCVWRQFELNIPSNLTREQKEKIIAIVKGD